MVQELSKLKKYLTLEKKTVVCKHFILNLFSLLSAKKCLLVELLGFGKQFENLSGYASKEGRNV